MSTALAEKREAGVPASIEDRINRRAAKIKTNISVAGNYIQLQKNGTLKMPNGEERDELEAVIIDYRYRKQFFPKPYQRGQFNEVVCWAFGDTDKGLVHDPNATTPQHPDCDKCPQNQFGSALNGGKGKACQDQFLMAVMLPDLGESEEIYLLKAPPTSSKPTATYVLNMTEQQGHPIKVVTKFRVEVPHDYQELKCSFGGPNMSYGDHAAHMDAAERLLTASPTGKRSDQEENIDTAVDKKAKRQGRSAAS